MVTLSGASSIVFSNAALPVLLGFAEHARDQIDVDLRKAERLRELVGAEDLRRSVRAPVHLEDVVVEILDAEAEPRHAHLANRGEFGLGQRARLALERDFLGRRPRRDGRQPLHQAAQLPHRQERRRPAAEVHEVERTAVDRGIGVIELPFAGHHVEILFDFLRVLVGVDAEIAEVAALPAERDVQVQAERYRRRRRAQRSERIPLDGIRRPDGKRRIVGNEVAADLRLVHRRALTCFSHRFATIRCARVAKRPELRIHATTYVYDSRGADL